jgi:predicted 3-demethylubiquinone-9 3-methyltransferase (glyoxalase superfamily)
MQKITPFLWFDTQAEEAAKFYTSIFKDAEIVQVTRYDKSAQAVSGKPAGSVMTVRFKLEGQEFVALNGGPQFSFSEAISFVVYRETQAELDELWNKLSAVPESEQCGWLKDKFGLSWQIVPSVLDQLLSDPDPARASRATAAMLKMKKLDIQTLMNAAAGKSS